MDVIDEFLISVGVLDNFFVADVFGIAFAVFNGCVTGPGAAAPDIKNAHAGKNRCGYSADQVCSEYCFANDDHTDDHPEYTGKCPIVKNAVFHIHRAWIKYGVPNETKIIPVSRQFGNKGYIRKK